MNTTQGDIYDDPITTSDDLAIGEYGYAPRTAILDNQHIDIQHPLSSNPGPGGEVFVIRVIGGLFLLGQNIFYNPQSPIPIYSGHHSLFSMKVGEVGFTHFSALSIDREGTYWLNTSHTVYSSADMTPFTSPLLVIRAKGGFITVSLSCAQELAPSQIRDTPEPEQARGDEHLRPVLFAFSSGDLTPTPLKKEDP